MYVFLGYINSTEMSVCLQMISQCECPLSKLPQRGVSKI